MQERAILLLRSETGKHEDFAQQREVFFNGSIINVGVRELASTFFV